MRVCDLRNSGSFLPEHFILQSSLLGLSKILELDCVVGNKTRSVQVAFIYVREDQIAYGLLERIVLVTSPGPPLCDFTSITATCSWMIRESTWN